MKIEAPFTDAQVEALNAWQASAHVHPFTCGGDRRDLAHVTYARDHGQGDMGILIATSTGWHCPVCDYQQAWAHDFMADPDLLPPPSPLIKPKARRGFAAMSVEKRTEIARKGGGSVPGHKRSFYKDGKLASAAGKKGGEKSKGGGRVKPL